MRISDWSSDVCSSDLLTAITAQRLHHHFPQARIVFTIRRQEDMIRSFYGRHGRVLVNVPAPYTDRHVSFAAWLEHAYRNLPAGILGVADYERTIEIYRALFGADRIAILLRSEEHTSELQSLMRISYAVFCLKKKTIKNH